MGEDGALDAAERRNLLLGAQTAFWQKQHPPDGMIIAAGSTGSIPATADLLNVIARLPKGAVVLPGLDLQSDGVYWQRLPANHPQAGMANLLSQLVR